MKLEILTPQKEIIDSNLTNYGTILLHVVLGSIFLGLMAQIALPLPFTVVPLSMQSLGVSLLAITLGSRKASLAVFAYLLQATMGLPVLAGGLSNPLWMIGPKAGYLMGFIAAAYVVGRLIETHSKKSFLKNWALLSLNEGIILLCGASVLSLFVGIEHAFVMGILPFIPGALLKITIAASSIKPIEWIKQK